MSNIQVDDRQVLAMFGEMDEKNRKKVFRGALRQSANILVRQTRKNLRSIQTKSGRTIRTGTPNRWNGKKMEQGIKSKMEKGDKSIKVHLLGDFRLKFFEMGTKDRYTKGNKITGSYWSQGTGRGRKYLARAGKGGYRGRIGSSRFFARSKQETESRIFSEMGDRFSKQVIKVNERHK